MIYEYVEERGTDMDVWNFTYGYGQGSFYEDACMGSGVSLRTRRRLLV